MGNLWSSDYYTPQQKAILAQQGFTQYAAPAPAAPVAPPKPASAQVSAPSPSAGATPTFSAPSSSPSPSFSSSPSPVSTWSDPRDARERALRLKGYNDVFGAGGGVAFEKANNLSGNWWDPIVAPYNIDRQRAYGLLGYTGGYDTPDEAAFRKKYGLTDDTIRSLSSAVQQPGYTQPKTARDYGLLQYGFNQDFGSGKGIAYQILNGLNNAELERVGQPYLEQENYNKQIQDSIKSFYDQILRSSTVPTSQQPNNTPVTYTRPAEKARPGSLSDLNGLTAEQLRSALATRAIYGTGLSNDEQDYYLNLLQRDYLDESNTPREFDILPIERQYLQYLGLPFSNTKDFLNGITTMQNLN